MNIAQIKVELENKVLELRGQLEGLEPITCSHIVCDNCKNLIEAQELEKQILQARIQTLNEQLEKL